ncbi:S-adenosyl-L-methionine-dependent methyltransferase [Polyplosphaeria fusca]|uniref:S-adenosyl-L-methionine-dependent methyltransferase n=1 Tax=Polyplosphaeria fusca TaxID=682080 RepID=A0A9P4R655_9PLEO|nr:S-adenosyl-L-methionine-dependent methyltransferase [Polyplosphaeria fusca]
METSISSRIEALSKDIELISKDVQNEDEKRKLQGIFAQATSKLQQPVESIWEIIMSPHAPTALMVVIQMGILKAVVDAGKPITAKELANITKGDEMLIIRLMRPLTAKNIFLETDITTYTSTPISQTLTAPPLLGGYQFMFDCATRSLANLPTYLTSTSYTDVVSTPGPFQAANNTADGMFPYLMATPSKMANFNAFMAGSLETRPDWFRTFPVPTMLLADAKPDASSVLLVDVGGGNGHDVEAFGRAFPDAEGRLVLQDLTPVIEGIQRLDARVERQVHDFFTPQPVRGARAYYFRYIFHDWPDDVCVQIMKHTAAAMEKGYSKMLIFEWVLPEKGVPLYPALLDINMMAVLNGRERTERQWRELLGRAGLKVVDVHKVGEESEGLIEAVLE